MTVQELSLTTSPQERMAASTAMLDKRTWAERRLVVLGLPLPLALGSGIGVAWLMGDPLGAAGLVALYTVLGGLIGTIIGSRFLARRYRGLYATSTLAARAQPVSLSDEGLCLQARRLPWSDISGQSRWKQATLLHFSAVDALVIPDRDLPADLSLEDFQAQVAKWLKR
jgi:hypothetical protein